MSKLILIEKPATPADVGRKYRPICLLDVLGKVLESIINRKLNDELDRTGSLNDNQYGFRKAHEGFEREISEAKREERDATVERWQREWRAGYEESATAVWTKKLIPDIRPWIGRKFGEVTYAGTGALQATCTNTRGVTALHVRTEMHTPEHMLFQCVRFEQIRVEAELRLGENLTWESVVPMMVRDKHSWDTVTTMMKRMVEIKEGEERQPRTAD
ncbi:hypothetical protein HUJ05_000723 [Dendroctonus ponderosae]|nr:hypothetical protein HUJ05_000723 [Dendroctonus ponderosae]